MTHEAESAEAKTHQAKDRFFGLEAGSGLEAGLTSQSTRMFKKVIFKLKVRIEIYIIEIDLSRIHCTQRSEKYYPKNLG